MGFLLKIAIFAVVAYGAWSAARRLLGILGILQVRTPPASPATPRRDAPAAAAPRPAIEDTRLCPKCSAYVPVGAAKCDRSDCPQPA